MKSSVRPARLASSALLSSFELQSLTSYLPKLPRGASQVIHLLCPWRRRAVQKLHHVSRMPWSKMSHLPHLSNGVCEGILPFWIAIHWLFQKIDLPEWVIYRWAKPWERLISCTPWQRLQKHWPSARSILEHVHGERKSCVWGCVFFRAPIPIFRSLLLYPNLDRETHTSGSLPCTVLITHN